MKVLVPGFGLALWSVNQQVALSLYLSLSLCLKKCISFQVAVSRTGGEGSVGTGRKGLLLPWSWVAWREDLAGLIFILPSTWA